MPGFENILQILALFAGVMGIIVAAGFGFKKLGNKPSLDPRVIEKLADIEATLSEIEERLDVTERVLADVRGRVQIPPRP